MTWSREGQALLALALLLHQPAFPLARAAYGLIMRPNDFASYLLAIGICNLLLYFAFYIIMKVGGWLGLPACCAAPGRGWAPPTGQLRLCP